jgi:hypothetical protein
MKLPFLHAHLVIASLSIQGVLAFGGGGGASAAGEWDNEAGDNEWTTPENWGEDQAPDATTAAFFGEGSEDDQVVIVDSNVTAEGIEVDDTINGTFSIVGNGVISLTTGIVNEQADIVTINPMIQIMDGDFTISATEDSTAGNSLILDGGIFAFSNASLTVNADESGSGTSSVTLNGDLAASITNVDFTGNSAKLLNGTGNAYSGGTAVSGGTLNVGGNISSGSSVSIASGATLNHLENSIFGWSLDAPTSALGGSLNQGNNYNTYNVGGTLTGTGAVFDIVLSGNSFGDTFWDTDLSWDNIISGTGSFSSLSDVFSGGISVAGVSSGGVVAGQGSFSLSGNTLSWTAVPEPSSLLVGGLIGLGLLQRRRSKVS